MSKARIRLSALVRRSLVVCFALLCSVTAATTSTSAANTAVADAGTSTGSLTVLQPGHTWICSGSAESSQCLQLRYSNVDVNNHVAANTLKANLAPFVTKYRQSTELSEPKATVRVRSSRPVIYFRGLLNDEDDGASSSSSKKTHDELCLVRMEVKGKHRIVTDISFNEFTGHAKRRDDVIGLRTERVEGTDWFKLTPESALERGEYGLLQLPHGDAVLVHSVFDFAVDPEAAEDPNAKSGPRLN